MRHFAIALAFSMVLACLTVPQAHAQEEDARMPGEVKTDNAKRGQTGLKFLAMSVSARAAGMGNAMTAMEAGATAMFYNPATMAHNANRFNVAVGQTKFAADIDYNMASATFQPAGNWGTFGFMFMNVDYGEFEGTIRADNDAGYISTGTFSPTALMVGVSYARALTDRFAVGANVKYATQDLSESVMGFSEGGGADNTGSYIWQGNSANALAVDFGAIYKTGFRSLNFAMSARNFSKEIVFEEENLELPLMLTIGVSMDMLDLAGDMSDTHSLVLAVDAMRPRDFYESVNVGAEYSFMNLFFLRGGYAFPQDEQGINLGAGVNIDAGGVGVGADYAYTSFGILGNVHRVSVQFGL